MGRHDERFRNRRALIRRLAVLLPMTLILAAADGTSVPTATTTAAIDVVGDATTPAFPRPDAVRPMRILILTEPSPLTYVSGQSVRFCALLQHLSEEYPSDQVQLITVDEGSHPDARPTHCGGSGGHGIPVHYASGWHLPQYPTMTLSTGISRKLWTLCRAAEKPDIIHISTPGFLVASAIIASRLLGIPLLMSYHTHLPVSVRAYVPYPPVRRVVEGLVWRMLRFVHSMADLTLVTSPQMADEFVSRGIRDVQVWPKGVNATRFHPRHRSVDMRSKMSSGHPNDVLLVYIGRLAKEKRVPDLKRVLYELEQVRGIPTRLCIVGDGPEGDALRREFRDTPTVFLGALEGESLFQAFASGDVFVMPSDSETLGFVVMESMASGVPAVACRAGGLMDVIRDDETGYLVAVGDIDGYVTRIEALMTDVTLRNRVVHGARAAVEEWSWHASMEFLRREAYSTAISNFERRRGSKQPSDG
jgi:sulfoquinovosyltransferase